MTFCWYRSARELRKARYVYCFFRCCSDTIGHLSSTSSVCRCQFRPLRAQNTKKIPKKYIKI